ncbi:MAG: hypothetical protein H6658_14715 [Ardenticatenaceae bacterium]|nr:hypothetical protein [Ardenticatenaceae bacterium]
MSSWGDRVGGNALYQLARLTSATARFQLNGEAYLQSALDNGRPLIFAAWHGMTMMLVGMFRTRLDLSRIVLILPDDWRGNTLVIFATKLGAQPFPMNLEGDASMATARKLSQLVKQVKVGQYCYITPDGPFGPSYVMKPGLTYIAQKAGALIVPVGAYARHSYALNRWDRYTIPYPFSRIALEVGEPITVEKGADLTAVNHTLTQTLNQVTLQAAANYYEK